MELVCCGGATNKGRLDATNVSPSMPLRIASIHAVMAGSLRSTITSFVHRLLPAAVAPLPLAEFGASIRMTYSNPSLMFLVRLTVAALSNSTMPLANPDASSEMKNK